MPALFSKFTELFDNLSLGVLALAVGGIMWVTQINLTTNSNAEVLKKLSDDVTGVKMKIETDRADSQKALYDHLTSIDNRLSRIEGKLSQ